MVAVFCFPEAEGDAEVSHFMMFVDLWLNTSLGFVDRTVPPDSIQARAFWQWVLRLV